MHALSPQMMLWDPASMGVPTQPSEMQQAHILTGFPTVVPQAFRFASALPQIYAGATVQNPNDGVVWIQHPQIVGQEPTREDLEQGSAPIMTHSLLSGQVPVATQQQGLIPFVMSPTGQRVIGQHPITQGGVSLQGHHMSGNFIHVTESGQTVVHSQPEGVQLVSLAGINQRMQHGIRLNSALQRQQNAVQAGLRLATSSSQEKAANSTERAILTPRRRAGNAFANCDMMTSWRRISDERSLGGSNTAIRRRSQSMDREQDANDGNSGSPTPNKRVAPTPFPIINNFEVHNDFWRAPDSRILRKLVDIIEYYFSDECLTKNGYMLKQLSTNEGDGFISLRRVASLKRVKSQTRDIRTVAYAVRQSDKLEINEDGTMIRRKRPLPDSIEAPRFIRSVLAINLPKDAPSVEDVTSLFKPFGDLTQVRVLRPGKSIPSYLKDYTAWVPDLGTRVCAVVEFENQDEAQKACREINMQNRGQNSLRVALLKPGARIRRTLYRKYKDETTELTSGNTDPVAQSEDVAKEKQDPVTSSNCRSRCFSESSDGSAHERVSKPPASSNNSNNKGVENVKVRYHYDASGSGSDTGSDTDSVGSKKASYRIPTKLDNKSNDSTKKCHSFADSGYSQSSSDERDSLIMSPTPEKVTENGLCSSDSTSSGSRMDGEESPKISSPGRRNSPVQKKFIDGVPVGVARQPKGPTSDSKGFTTGLRHV